MNMQPRPRRFSDWPEDVLALKWQALARAEGHRPTDHIRVGNHALSPNSVRVLEAIGDQAMTVPEIERVTGLTNSSVHNIVNALMRSDRIAVEYLSRRSPNGGRIARYRRAEVK